MRRRGFVSDEQRRAVMARLKGKAGYYVTWEMKRLIGSPGDPWRHWKPYWSGPFPGMRAALDKKQTVERWRRTAAINEIRAIDVTDRRPGGSYIAVKGKAQRDRYESHPKAGQGAAVMSLTRGPITCPHCGDRLGSGDEYDLMRAHQRTCPSEKGRMVRRAEQEWERSLGMRGKATVRPSPTRRSKKSS